jgi:hypothetical protein
MAFQKWQGLARDGDAGPQTTAALATATRPTPRTAGGGRRFEVLLDRQLTLYIENGTVVRTLHVSTGAAGFETPTGRYAVFRKEQNSWSVPYKVWLPWASYFVGGVAFHESPDVPPAPASHGCVRVPRYDAKWLYDHAPNGTPAATRWFTTPRCSARSGPPLPSATARSRGAWSPASSTASRFRGGAHSAVPSTRHYGRSSATARSGGCRSGG